MVAPPDGKPRGRARTLLLRAPGGCSVLLRGLLLSAALLPISAMLHPIQAAPAQPAKTAPGQSAKPAVADRQMLLQADQIVYDGDGQTVAAQGHVEIVDQDHILHSDNVIYDQKTDKVTANGHVSVTDAKGNVAFADHVVLVDRLRNGVLAGFGALIGKNGRLAAASAERVEDHLVIAHKSIYSPCKICNQPGQRTPLWQVKSEKVVYDQLTHRIHFTDATIDFFGVPLIYTPTLTQADPSVRYASGFLAPDVGNSSTLGYFARAPFYVSLTDHEDLTLAPEFTTKSGELIEGEYRARWNNSGLWLQGSFAYNSHGGLGGAPGTQEYDHLFGAGRIALDDTWRTGFDVQLTNNNAYMLLYDISNLDRLTNDLFVDDSYGRSRFSVTSYYFEGLRSTDVAARIPYVLPLINYSYVPEQNILGGSLRVDLNGQSLTRGTGRNDQRVTMETRWQRLLVMGAGQVWTVAFDARGDSYDIQSPATASKQSSSQFIERRTGYAELDWRWPFVASGAPGYSYLIEPIAQLIGQPYGGNPAKIRDEDSSDFEFDENNLFSVNQVPGFDLIETGPRTNVGMMAETFFPAGEASAVFGQTYRLKPDPIFAADSGELGTASDLVGQVNLKFPHLDFTDRLDVDRRSGVVNRHEFYITGTYGRSSLQVSYLQLPPEAVTLSLGKREQVNAQADVNFYQNWQAFAAIERDLEANQMLDSEYGLGYEDECLAISLAYRRKYTADAALGVPPSTSILLRFSLKTGDQPIQPFTLFPKNVFNSTGHL
jgi:LPS-assembly protein